VVSPSPSSSSSLALNIEDDEDQGEDQGEDERGRTRNDRFLAAKPLCINLSLLLTLPEGLRNANFPPRLFSSMGDRVDRSERAPMSAYRLLLFQRVHWRGGMCRTLTAITFAGLLAGISAGCSTTADFHNVDGVRLFQQGNYQPALQRFQQAVAANPQNSDAYYNLASTLHRIGSQTNNRQMLTQAETIYNQCLDLNDNHVDCRRGLAVLLIETDRAASAMKLMSNWVTQHPELADARVELARLHEEFGDIETAKLHLNQAVMVDQRNARAWAALGNIREKAGETEQAVANYRRSLSLNPSQPAVGARVASLAGTLTPDVNINLPNSSGTRTVTIPTIPTQQPRY
jgi:tetratricopeptide (TPR) repeat protein